MKPIQFAAGIIAGLLNAAGYGILWARNTLQRKFISGAFINCFDTTADAALTLRQWMRRN